MTQRWNAVHGVFGSLLLHVGLAVWILSLPQTITVMPQQRVIDVSIVMQSPVQESHKTYEVMKENEKKDVRGKSLREPVTSHSEIVQKVRPAQKQRQQPVKHIPQDAQKSKPEDHEDNNIIVKPTPITDARFVSASSSSAVIMPPAFNAAYLENKPPEYPSAARRRNITGKVILYVEVSKDGYAQSVIIFKSSGSEMLDEAARKAVTVWRFVPAKRGDEEVSASVAVPIAFVLN